MTCGILSESAPSGRQSDPEGPLLIQRIRSGCQKSGFLMVHKSLTMSKSRPKSNRPIRHQAQHYARDSPGYRRPTRVTRYELISCGVGVAKNELKVGLFGSDEMSLLVVIMSKSNAVVCLGVMSASEIRGFKSEKRFP